VPGLRIFESGADRYEVEGEQCDDDCNSVRPIAPGVVVAYERNVDTTPTNAMPASRSSQSSTPSRPGPGRRRPGVTSRGGVRSSLVQARATTNGAQLAKGTT
jgi:hypothetical protein